MSCFLTFFSFFFVFWSYLLAFHPSFFPFISISCFLFPAFSSSFPGLGASQVPFPSSFSGPPLVAPLSASCSISREDVDSCLSSCPPSRPRGRDASEIVCLECKEKAMMQCEFSLIVPVAWQLSGVAFRTFVKQNSLLTHLAV